MDEADYHLLVLASRTRKGLEQRCAQLAASLGTDPETRLADIALALQIACQELEYRSFTVASEPYDALLLTSALVETAGVRERSTAFLFPGGRRGYPAAGSGLYADRVEFRIAVDRCVAAVRSVAGYDLTAHFGASGTQELSDDDATHALVLFSIQYGLAELLRSFGVVPTAVAGDGLGGYAAACVAGTMSLDDAVRGLAGGAGTIPATTRKPGRTRAHVPTVDASMAVALDTLIDGDHVVVEIGPGDALITRLRKDAADRGLSLSTLTTLGRPGIASELGRVLYALGSMWSQGVSVDWPLLAGLLRTQSLRAPR